MKITKTVEEDLPPPEYITLYYKNLSGIFCGSHMKIEGTTYIVTGVKGKPFNGMELFLTKVASASVGDWNINLCREVELPT